MEEETQNCTQLTSQMGGVKRPSIDYDFYENYNVQVETLERGYVLSVGCKRFAIESTEVLINMLTKYFTNPGEIQKQFHEKTLEIK